LSGSRTSRETRRRLLVYGCALISAHALCAREPNHAGGEYIVTEWDARNLFPGGSINAIAQTPDGYLWIGAENGLVRFDGISFRLLEHADTPSLPSGPVLSLAVDSAGALWVRMESPYLLRYRGGSFEQMYRLTSPERGATAMTRGSRGDILIARGDGPLRYNGEEFVPVASTGVPVGGLAISIAETAYGVIWVGMRDAGLFSVRAGHGSVVTGLPDKKVNVLLPGAGPELWIGTDAGLVRWDGSAITHPALPPAIAHGPIQALARDHESNLWIATPGGLTRIGANGAVVQESEADVPGTVHAIFEDREGNLWLGGTDGLMQLRKPPFLSYAGAGEGGPVYLDSSGRAWTGPDSGGLVWIRGAEHGSVTGLGLERAVVYSITGGPGELWLGRREGGVTQLREEDGTFEARTYTTADGLAPGAVYTVYRSRDGTVWAGTLGGAVSRIQKERVTTYTAANGLSGDAVNIIEETPDGTIWVGTGGGLEAFRGGSWRRYGGEDGMPPGRVNSLALDGDGVLWIGSSAGLLYWSGKRIESAGNVPDSLRGEIYGMAADDAGNLWLATDRRVVRLARAALLGRSAAPAGVREFGTADGLPSSRGIRRDRPVAKDPSGRIWFSLDGGLCVVNPLHPEAVAPALVDLESVAVDGQPLGTGPVLRYSSSHQRIVFSFIGLSLAVPSRVRYRYRLAGYDHDWSQPTESREAGYTNLTPASYTFRVMASNSEGLWNGAPASVTIVVEPQLWQTAWFRAVALCLSAAALFAVFRYRMARAHAAMNLRFEERLAERTRIARDLHDTLLQSFHGLMLQFQVVSKMLPEGKAKDHLEKALERADQAIAEGRSAVYDLRASTTLTNDLCEALGAVGNELSVEGAAEFDLAVEGRPRDLHPIIRDELYRISREALRNAFQHSRASRIEAEVSYGERVFRLRIRDDGEGIPAEILEGGRPGHYGIAGIRERAKQVGAELTIWSRAGSGTEIELSLASSMAYGTPPHRSGFGLLRRKRDKT